MSLASSWVPRGEEFIGTEQWLGYESLFASVDILHCALLFILLVGFLLASFTEDASSDSLRVSWIATQLLPRPRSQPGMGAGGLTDVQQMLNKLAEQKAAQRLKTIVQPLMEAVEEGRLSELISDTVSRFRDNVAFYARVLYVRRFAEGTRHLFYMAQKIKLGIEVRPGESEVSTYVEAKKALQEDNRWPFMVEISDVKSDQVTCAGNKKAYPMSSYSYLDFIREPQVQEAAIAAAREWSTGSHGARMLGGNSTILRDLERAVARYYGRDDALLCATGFLATMSAVAAVSKKGDLIVADNRAHASLRTGMCISGARYLFFKHNNYAHLKRLLQKERSKARNCWIVIESVYSMEGDIADLPVVRSLADSFNAKIICDEAHGLGILGATGRGLEEYFNMPGACEVLCGTFSKSIGGVGGFITCKRPLVDFMDFHAPGSVFSASLTAYSAGGALKAFELMTGTQQWRIQKAQENARYLRHLIETGDGHWPADYPEELKYEVEGMSCTTVIPVVFPNSPQRMFRITTCLLDKGFYCAAAAFPACPLLRPRLRITATAAYSKELMHAFVRALVQTTVEMLPDDQHNKKTPRMQATTTKTK
ncbi:serine palmitoyltransferase, putative [Eimeria maxima]|uniref:serine C-palmitoyltransferase n=1 Tax=Eimeria maxima TaxID=5804 RepID=U6M8D5_EIMMA|nr:serine palmitoyltransferase, putative [Eimeria maxima]CDJ60286.1 serine palmitoyltransferase, putative [Eimeria maxima]